MTDSILRDWTTGGDGLAFQACPACRGVWYIRRPFCPRCGKPEPEARQASGRGTVHAITAVSRPPSSELKSLAPYPVALIDAEEGFRFMAHAEAGLAIGDRVTVEIAERAGRRIPFVRSSTAKGNPST